MKPRKPTQDAAAGDSVEGPTKNLMETALATTRLQAFERATSLAGLAKLLRGKGPFTVFAPTDRAFAKLPDAEREALFADAKALERILSMHIVRDKVKAPLPGTTRSVTTMSGQNLEITRDAAGYQVNDARIVKTRIKASNGVIHAIDTMLVPR